MNATEHVTKLDFFMCNIAREREQEDANIPESSTIHQESGASFVNGPLSLGATPKEEKKRCIKMLNITLAPSHQPSSAYKRPQEHEELDDVDSWFFPKEIVSVPKLPGENTYPTQRKISEYEHMMSNEEFAGMIENPPRVQPLFDAEKFSLPTDELSQLSSPRKTYSEEITPRGSFSQEVTPREVQMRRELPKGVPRAGRKGVSLKPIISQRMSEIDAQLFGIPVQADARPAKKEVKVRPVEESPVRETTRFTKADYLPITPKESSDIREDQVDTINCGPKPISENLKKEFEVGDDARKRRESRTSITIIGGLGDVGTQDISQKTKERPRTISESSGSEGIAKPIETEEKTKISKQTPGGDIMKKEEKKLPFEEKKIETRKIENKAGRSKEDTAKETPKVEEKPKEAQKVRRGTKEPEKVPGEPEFLGVKLKTRGRKITPPGADETIKEEHTDTRKDATPAPAPPPAPAPAPVANQEPPKPTSTEVRPPVSAKSEIEKPPIESTIPSKNAPQANLV